MAMLALLSPAIAEAIYNNPKAVKDALQAYAAQNEYLITV
jgi:hypothetical protein